MTTAIDPPLFTLLARSPKDLELLGLEWGMIPQVSGLWSISEVVDGKRRVRHGLIHHVYKQANYALKNFTPEFFFCCLIPSLATPYILTFSTGGIFIGNRCRRISNQAYDVNSHLVILSSKCNTENRTTKRLHKATFQSSTFNKSTIPYFS